MCDRSHVGVALAPEKHLWFGFLVQPAESWQVLHIVQCTMSTEKKGRSHFLLQTHLLVEVPVLEMHFLQ